jgi:NAD(P)-dependent dehydrogenase (short-subunit alcohol dehydrogenase family)
MSQLEGKTALVTGATGGIGEAIAKRFSNEGANVMLVGRSSEKLEATNSRLGGGANLARFVADATDEAATSASVAATLEAFGGLDILVANAGTEGKVKPFETQTMEEFETVLRTNVIGVWLSMKYSIEAMKRGNGGSMIAMSSIAGLVGFPGLGPYSASKHAVYGMVKTAALELGEAGIRVNAICPGGIDNRMMRSLAEQLGPDDPDATRAGLESLSPMKRYGTNEEVANIALFLASDSSSYCTGQAFTLDGGFTAG